MGREQEERLIARMRNAVQQAKANYYHAREDFNLAKLIELQNPNGRYGLYQATIRERRALGEFRRLLCDFNRLILDGKLRDEPAERSPP